MTITFSFMFKSKFTRNIAYTILLVLLGYFIYEMIVTAWLAEDAYITFRSVQNFINGEGLRWNIAERVQSYTHPLWMFLISGVYFVTREFDVSIPIMSMLFSFGSVVLILRKVSANIYSQILFLASILASKAFLDYTTSGLENPLTFFLLAVFYAIFLSKTEVKNYSIQRLGVLTCIVALALTNRLDSVLLFAPALIYAFLDMSQKHDLKSYAKRIGVMFIAAIPIFAWEAFSLLYYGRLFPNTAYAKLQTGIPQHELTAQGVAYFVDSLLIDPVTIIVIFTAIILSLRKRTWKDAVVGLGIGLYVAYILKIGGDFMSGRFLSAPFFLAAIYLSIIPLQKSKKYIVAIVVLLLMILYPHTQVYDYLESKDIRYIKEIYLEREFYAEHSSFLDFGEKLADHRYSKEGAALNDGTEKVYEKVNIGFFGVFAGPLVHIVDPLALSDPLLAQIPVYNPERFHPQTDWRIGHIRRVVPVGYKETLETGENVIEDPGIAAYYDVVKILTRDPIFSEGRLQTIWKANTGGYDDLITETTGLESPFVDFTPANPAKEVLYLILAVVSTIVIVLIVTPYVGKRKRLVVGIGIVAIVLELAFYVYAVKVLYPNTVLSNYFKSSDWSAPIYDNRQLTYTHPVDGNFNEIQVLMKYFRDVTSDFPDIQLVIKDEQGGVVEEKNYSYEEYARGFVEGPGYGYAAFRFPLIENTTNTTYHFEFSSSSMKESSGVVFAVLGADNIPEGYAEYFEGDEMVKRYDQELKSTIIGPRGQEKDTQ